MLAGAKVVLSCASTSFKESSYSVGKLRLVPVRMAVFGCKHLKKFSEGNKILNSNSLKSFVFVLQ